VGCADVGGFAPPVEGTTPAVEVDATVGGALVSSSSIGILCMCFWKPVERKSTYACAALRFVVVSLYSSVPCVRVRSVMIG
jgi:hypothetical protein